MNTHWVQGEAIMTGNDDEAFEKSLRRRRIPNLQMENNLSFEEMATLGRLGHCEPKYRKKIEGAMNDKETLVARLIAAAPELLEALHEMLGYQSLAPAEVIERARQAYRNATGEEP